jgi:hypothetical protein
LKRKRREQIFIQPPHLKFDFIRQKADEFREQYVRPPDLLPVPIIEIVEVKLGLMPIPIVGLLESEDIDGFLTRDLTSICVDRDIYIDPRKETRLRFTYAHEIGHLVLHKKEIQQCAFRTPEDWKYFHQDFSKEDLNWFEQHAYEFAGRLLVPRAALEAEVGALTKKIEEYRKREGIDEERLIDAVARVICTKFQVSPDCLARRLRIEKLLELSRRRR